MNSMPIAEKIKQGDNSAFEKVFREYFAPLTLFATGILNDKDLAEEIVQDFFYNFWKDRDQINIRVSLKSYFFQSVRNKALKYIRHENVKHKYAAQVLEANEPSTFFFEPNIYELKELEKSVHDILERLPPNCSLIFRMNRFDGMKYREIAEKLSISVKTVEANMSKALATFRNELKPYRSK